MTTPNSNSSFPPAEGPEDVKLPRVRLEVELLLDEPLRTEFPTGRAVPQYELGDRVVLRELDLAHSALHSASQSNHFQGSVFRPGDTS